MTKPTCFLLLTIAISLAPTDDASAGWRRWRCNNTNAVPVMAPAIVTPAVPAATPAPAMTPQANTGSSYQSFSYEPGTAAPAVATTTPVQYYRAPLMAGQYYGNQSNWTEYNNVIRGDKKVRDLAR